MDSGTKQDQEAEHFQARDGRLSQGLKPHSLPYTGEQNKASGHQLISEASSQVKGTKATN